MSPSPAADAEVLLVEDHVLVRRVLANTLADAGYRVVEARTGDEALALLRGGLRPLLLLSDVRMPGSLNGLELARQARTLLPGVPILLTTGYNELSTHEFRLLLKPYAPEELLGCIDEILGGAGAAGACSG